MRVVSRRWRTTALERYYAELDIEQLRKQLEAARDNDEDVSLTLLLNVATMRSSQFRVSQVKRALAQEFHDPLLAKWRRMHQGSKISASPPQAMIVLEGGDKPDFTILTSPVAAPDFDWSAARVLLNRVDEITELAQAWIHDAKGRIPHMERAYACATQVLGAVQRERWRREAAGLTAGDPPSEAMTRELDGVEPQVATAEQLFRLSATQDAQSNYINGMLWGSLIIALVCGAGGWLLYHFEEPASLGIAFATGALGGVISVLQRLTSGSLVLDFREPRGRVRFSGAIRPWIGAIFGMVVYALLQSGLIGVEVDAPEQTGPELAYFAVLGFLAGFNERFAQDVVTTTAGALGGTFSASQGGTQAIQGSQADQGAARARSAQRPV